MGHGARWSRGIFAEADLSAEACARDLVYHNYEMPTLFPLKKMTRTQKLRAMEELWTDLSANEKTFDSPAWHEATLHEAKAALASGRAKFSDWDEAKKRILRKAVG